MYSEESPSGFACVFSVGEVGVHFSSLACKPSLSLSSSFSFSFSSSSSSSSSGWCVGGILQLLTALPQQLVDLSYLVLLCGAARRETHFISFSLHQPVVYSEWFHVCSLG
jgi:hypothetical protein